MPSAWASAVAASKAATRGLPAPGRQPVGLDHLTVAELRDLLTEQGIEAPTSARKADLIALAGDAG